MIAQSVEGRATSWTAGVRFSARVRNIPRLHSVKAGTGANQAYSIMFTGGCFPGCKAAEE
jgi:hypothetical protein